MEYDEFCRIMKTELPLNRKERFYTGTVLPALLFHNGWSNFYTFLREIKDFPVDVNETQTNDNFIFCTEYNLKESAGDRSVGRKMNVLTNDTPDVIIEILKPRVFIIIEAKMFEKTNQHKIDGQIDRQRSYIAGPLRKAFQMDESQIFHIALVPEASRIKSCKSYQVINWEFFIGNQSLDVTNNYFHNYLRYALDNYEQLVSKATGGGLPNTVEFHLKGPALYDLCEENPDHWVGRMGGEKKIQEDFQSDKWRKHMYCVNSVKPVKGQPGNWIPLMKFRDLKDKYGSPE